MNTRTGFFLTLVCLTGIAAAAVDPDDVPPELVNWQRWVLHDTEFLKCPVRLGADPGNREGRLCAWPGALEVAVDESGGRFAIAWRVFDSSWVPLPGGGRTWPLEVRIDGTTATVAERGGRPHLWLEAGEHRLSGQFRWDQRPRTLAVPEAIALISLSVDGAPIEQIARDGGDLWLGRRAREEAPEAASADLIVQRRIDDGVPLMLTTRIELRIAGQAREETLGRPLLAGFVPTAIDSELPLRLDEDGALVAQVRPGSWLVELQSRALKLPEQLELSDPHGLWPAEETWSFAANPPLRVAGLEGVPAIDPQQADIPPEWQHLPSYLVRPGDQVAIVERTRGMAADEGNRLSLQRRAWLDFDAGGFTVLDALSGQMRQGWRVDLIEPLRMSSAEADEPLLVTTLEAGRSGVELRNPNVHLRVGGRIEGNLRSLPVAGYDRPLEQVKTELNLPPGYRLVAALNTDFSPESWINRWSLLDLFLVLILGAVFWRVFSPWVGVVAGAYLLLGYHEAGSPVWSLLVAAACVGVLPLVSGLPQTLLKWLRNATFLIIAVLAVPFVAGQLRMAIYPQLERAGYGIELSGMLPAAVPPPMAPQDLAQAPAVPEPARRRAEAEFEQVLVTGSRIKRAEPVSRYLPGALVQTGYGRPSWRWNAYQLSWSGPVLPEQTLRLIIAPPWLVSLLRLVLVALFAVVLMKLFGSAIRPAVLRRLATGSLVLLALPAVALAAEIPDEKLRAELKARLTEPPECSPACGLIERAGITAGRGRLEVALRVHASADVALPLPDGGEAWIWRAVSLDGRRVDWIHRDPDGARWLHLVPGLHELSIDGILSAADSFTLQFPERPRDVSAAIEGWEASGLVNRQVPGGGINFVRIRDEQASRESFSPQFLRLPEFVRIERIVNFDLDWSLSTRIHRVAPAEGSLTVSLPLWPGETVSTPDVEVAGGRTTVSFAPGISTVAFDSRLEQRTALELTAGDEDHFVESWQLVVSPIWHLEASGVPLSMPPNPGDFWSFDFYPRRGESVALTLSRPDPVGGETVAVDRAKLSVQAGRRALEARLGLEIRSTRGDQHPLTLPPEARVDQVTIDGEAPLNLRSDQGRLLIPLSPGSQEVDVAWQQDREIGLITRTPPVNLGARASNLDLELSLPRDRWVLLTRGPRVGPAVLIWGEVLVMALVAWALGRSTRTPLKYRHWLLLGFGFSTVSWIAYLVVIVWLFLVAWRGEQKAQGRPALFNLKQFALASLTLLALGSLVSAIPYGLLGEPDMHIAGYQSYGNTLRWFADSADGPIPQASVVSIPLWWYQGAMLAWALWLSAALLRWLPWVWRCLSADRFWMGRVAAADKA